MDGNAGRLFRAVAVSAAARSDDSGWKGMGRDVGVICLPMGKVLRAALQLR